ncbi:hypothetical protein P355_3824 [Burkholderia cenocepacia KC-01]|nr:hypothetical protein P355_3824 [Burkholderia cenocepacia KC-01]
MEMTGRLCQRGCGADRTIRLFSGHGGRSRTIDANPHDRRARTRGSCRRGRPIRPLLLWECLYDACTAALPPPKGRTGRRARRGGAALIGRRRGATPDRAADRAACAGQHAAILRFERRRMMRERLFALIQFR